MRSLAVLVLLAACAARSEPEEWNRPYPLRLPDTDEAVASLVVLDRWTGRPIAGARVSRHPEDVFLDGAWAPCVGETTTDAYGVANIPIGEEWVFDDWSPFTCHWVVDAPGYAVTEVYGGRPDLYVELEPGETLRGRIRGPFGEPAVGLPVELKIGCAHSPGVRRATTDEAGIFVFHDNEDGDVTYGGPGIRADYWSGMHSGPLRPPHMAPPTETAWPGARIVGRIDAPPDVLAAIEGVQSDTSGRGPNTQLAEDGSFVLEGADLDGAIWILFRDRASQTFEAKQYRPGGPFVHRLGAAPQPEATVTACVRVLDAATGEALRNALVHLDRVTDGRRTSGRTLGLWDDFEDAHAELEVAPGRYELSVGAPDERWVAAPRPVEVRGGDEPFVVRATEQPRLRLLVQGTLDEDAAKLNLILPDRYWRLDPEKEEVRLPAEVRAAVRVDQYGAAHFFPVGPARDGERVATIAVPPPTEIRVADLAGDFYLFLAWTAIGDDSDNAAPRENGEIVLRTYETGPFLLVCERAGSGVALVDLDLPDPPGGVVRVDTLPFVAPRTGRLLDGAGRPLEKAYVVMRPLGRLAGFLWPVEMVAPDGTLPVNLPNGFLWRLSGGPEAGRVEGSGPFEIRLGACGLDVVTRPDDTDVWVDGWRRERYEDGVVRARNLHAGPHDILVGAEDHEARALRVVLAEGETRKIEVTLAPR